MDELTAKVSPESDDAAVPESPKPLAFTIEFESPKAIDTQKHKNLLEKFQNRHRRGQSLSKLEETLPLTPTAKKHPHTGNLPRKSSFQSEGYFSSDEKSEKVKNVRTASLKLKSELTLPLKHLTTDKMTQSFPNRSFNLPSIESPEVELKDVSSPELESISPISPEVSVKSEEKVFLPSVTSVSSKSNKKVVRQYSSPEMESEHFIDGTEFDFDKSDTVSDAGTYTLDADNYTEEQKARMSIDNDFKLEQVSFMRKTEEYIQSLATVKEVKSPAKQKSAIIGAKVQQQPKVTETSEPKVVESVVKEPVRQRPHKSVPKEHPQQQPLQMIQTDFNGTDEYKQKQKRLSGHANTELMMEHNNDSNESAINVNVVYNKSKRGATNIDTALKQLSLSQNTTVTDEQPKQMNNGEGDLNDIINKTFTKIMFPSPKAKIGAVMHEKESSMDQGCFTSVTSSGVFSRRPTNLKHARKSSLVHSEIHVEAYTDDSKQNGSVHDAKMAMQKNCEELERGFDKMALDRVTNLPPAVGGYCGGGKMSPTKIPSPLHSLTRPRSRGGSLTGSNGIEMLSDSSLDLETESYLKPTQNYIQSLQTRLSLDSDSDCDIKLNNDTRNLLKQKLKHVRHNSFDDRNVRVSNKLEHFQTKNLQHHNIDQTYGVGAGKNQFYAQKAVHRIQNSPNDSPVKRSSSFSTKNQLDQAKSVNLIQQKELNLRNTPHLLGSTAITRGGSIQRSSSTANIRPNVVLRRASVTSENHDNIKVKERPRSYAETESSSEDDFMDHQNLHQNTKNAKKIAAPQPGGPSDLTTTRYNRAFSLRRGRLDSDAPASAPSIPKCPNTPEMKRKFMPTSEQHLRGVSVDRKVKSADVQSRYLNLGSKPAAVAAAAAKNAQQTAPPKSAPPGGTRTGAALKSQVFSRTDSGRFSMKSTTKPTHGASGAQKSHPGGRKDGQGKNKSGRSNSTLNSREVDFQNWKRRKSYDPMKAAAEGKKKAEMARKQHQNAVMVQSYNEQQQDYDSSPSHSASSVHRSQSFHGTAALDRLASSEEDEDLTLSADEGDGGGFSPPTPSPCEMSPAHRTRPSPWRQNLQ